MSLPRLASLTPALTAPTPTASDSGDALDGLVGLSLLQPWASLMAVGAKRIETRSWAPAKWGRGALPRAVPVLLHASRGFGALSREVWAWPECQEVFAALAPELRARVEPTTARGVALAVMDLVRIDPTTAVPRHVALTPALRLAGQEAAGTRVPRHEQRFGDYTPGRYGLWVTNVRPLARPIPVKGSLGFWPVPRDVIADVRAQLAA